MHWRFYNMEERLENSIDSMLDSFSPLLYIFNVLGGLLLLLIGVFLLMKSRQPKQDKKKIIGFTMIGLGALAIFSGVLQMI